MQTLKILSTFVLIKVPILVSALCFDWLINNGSQRSKSPGILTVNRPPSSFHEFGPSPFQALGPKQPIGTGEGG